MSDIDDSHCTCELCINCKKFPQKKYETLNNDNWFLKYQMEFHLRTLMSFDAVKNSLMQNKNTNEQLCLLCNFEASDKNMKCIGCKSFYSISKQNNYCSYCSIKNTDPQKFKDITIQKIFNMELNILQFVETGIHTSIKNDCTICLDENVKCCSKFNCFCYPSTCINCVHDLKKCPTCYATPFIKITKDQLALFITHPIEAPIILCDIYYDTIGLAEDEIDDKPFSFTHFITTTYEIVEVLEEHGFNLKSNDYQICSPIFDITGFAVDLKRFSEISYPGMVVCYGGIMNIFTNNLIELDRLRFTGSRLKIR
jgi:hypothetical protein